MRIGAQLYTARDFCKDTASFAETLAKIADIGYTAVQVSGTCDYDPQWLKNELCKNGLECVITHIPADRLKENPATVASEHDIFGCKYIGLGWFAFDEHKEGHRIADFSDAFRPVVHTLKENGKYFMYHNHDGEFAKYGGKTILEMLSEEFSPDEMGFTLDTYWIQAGGGDPAQWVERLSGRIPCIHLKDFAYGRKIAVLGEGNINFDRVFQKAADGGTEYMLVEQDDCNGEDPFDCLKRSYEYLKSRGFK